MQIKNLPNSPFFATLQITEAGVMIAGKVFDRNNGGMIFRELRPVPVCAARAAAAALQSRSKNNSYRLVIFTRLYYCCSERYMNDTK